MFKTALAVISGLVLGFALYSVVIKPTEPSTPAPTQLPIMVVCYSGGEVVFQELIKPLDEHLIYSMVRVTSAVTGQVTYVPTAMCMFQPDVVMPPEPAGMELLANG